MEWASSHRPIDSQWSPAVTIKNELSYKALKARTKHSSNESDRPCLSEKQHQLRRISIIKDRNLKAPIDEDDGHLVENIIEKCEQGKEHCVNDGSRNANNFRSYFFRKSRLNSNKNVSHCETESVNNNVNNFSTNLGEARRLLSEISGMAAVNDYNRNPDVCRDKINMVSFLVNDLRCSDLDQLKSVEDVRSFVSYAGDIKRIFDEYETLTVERFIRNAQHESSTDGSMTQLKSAIDNLKSVVQELNVSYKDVKIGQSELPSQTQEYSKGSKTYSHYSESEVTSDEEHVQSGKYLVDKIKRDMKYFEKTGDTNAIPSIVNCSQAIVQLANRCINAVDPSLKKSTERSVNNVEHVSNDLLRTKTMPLTSKCKSFLYDIDTLGKLIDKLKVTLSEEKFNEINLINLRDLSKVIAEKGMRPEILPPGKRVRAGGGRPSSRSGRRNTKDRKGGTQSDLEDVDKESQGVKTEEGSSGGKASARSATRDGSSGGKARGAKSDVSSGGKARGAKKGTTLGWDKETMESIQNEIKENSDTLYRTAIIDTFHQTMREVFCDALKSLISQLKRTKDRSAPKEEIHLRKRIEETIRKMIGLPLNAKNWDRFDHLTSELQQFYFDLSSQHYNVYGTPLVQKIDPLVALLEEYRSYLETHPGICRPDRREGHVLKHWMLITNTQEYLHPFEKTKSDRRVKQIEIRCKCRIHLMTYNELPSLYDRVPTGYRCVVITYDEQKGNYYGSMKMIMNMYPNGQSCRFIKPFKTLLRLENGKKTLLTNDELLLKTKPYHRPQAIVCPRLLVWPRRTHMDEARNSFFSLPCYRGCNYSNSNANLDSIRPKSSLGFHHSSKDIYDTLICEID